MGSTLPHETGGGDGIYGGVKESAPRPRGGPGSQWGKGPWRLKGNVGREMRLWRGYSFNKPREGGMQCLLENNSSPWAENEERLRHMAEERKRGGRKLMRLPGSTLEGGEDVLPGWAGFEAGMCGSDPGKTSPPPRWRASRRRSSLVWSGGAVWLAGTLQPGAEVDVLPALADGDGDGDTGEAEESEDEGHAGGALIRSAPEAGGVVRTRRGEVRLHEPEREERCDPSLPHAVPEPRTSLAVDGVVVQEGDETELRENEGREAKPNDVHRGSESLAGLQTVRLYRRRGHHCLHIRGVAGP
jgi:hypothetical protein